MPTTRQRHVLTETEELAAAIDAAVSEYPGQSRADIVRHLVELGAEALAERRGRRRRVVRERAGKYPGLYPPGYLEDLRSDWPE